MIEFHLEFLMNEKSFGSLENTGSSLYDISWHILWETERKAEQYHFLVMIDCADAYDALTLFFLITMSTIIRQTPWSDGVMMMATIAPWRWCSGRWIMWEALLAANRKMCGVAKAVGCRRRWWRRHCGWQSWLFISRCWTVDCSGALIIIIHQWVIARVGILLIWETGEKE